MTEYYGDLWRGDIDQPLIEHIPEEHFENPLYAKMVAVWLATEQPELYETIEEALNQLSVEEKLKLAAYIEGAGIEDPCGEHTVGVWGAPIDITVDENQVVRAIIGSLRDIDDAVLENHAIREHLIENVDDAVYAAAHRWRGSDYAHSISIQDETMRRYELAAQKRKTAEQAADQNQF